MQPNQMQAPMPAQPDPNAPPQGMPGGQPQGQPGPGDIRAAALQGLSPEEIQLIGRTVTPQFVQVMAKLFGDSAVQILQPLIGLDRDASQMSQAPKNPLQDFVAQAKANGNPAMQ